MSRTRIALRCLVPACALLLTACGGKSVKQDAPPAGESFDADSTYSHTFKAAPEQACEAARRALLGQGYTVTTASGSAVESSKSFQPDPDTHTQLDVRATCVAQDDGEALVFVNAVQDRYSLKKSSNSASVGVGVFGSLSLPVGSSDDSMVRVGSHTVQNTDFYKRFFERVTYYLPARRDAPPAAPPPPEPAAPPDPVPPVAPAPSPAASPSATPVQVEPASSTPVPAAEPAQAPAPATIGLPVNASPTSQDGSATPEPEPEPEPANAPVSPPSE